MFACYSRSFTQLHAADELPLFFQDRIARLNRDLFERKQLREQICLQPLFLFRCQCVDVELSAYEFLAGANQARHGGSEINSHIGSIRKDLHRSLRLKTGS